MSLGRREARLVVLGAEGRVAGALELAEVTLGVGQIGGGTAAVDPGERPGGRAPAGDQGADVEVRVAEATDGLVHHRERLLEAVPAAAGGAQRPQGGRAQPGRGGTGARGVGDGHPRPVAVVDEVEPVAASLVGRQRAAGQLGTLDSHDPGRSAAWPPPRGRSWVSLDDDIVVPRTLVAAHVRRHRDGPVATFGLRRFIRLPHDVRLRPDVHDPARGRPRPAGLGLEPARAHSGLEDGPCARARRSSAPLPLLSRVQHHLRSAPGRLGGRLVPGFDGSWATRTSSRRAAARPGARRSCGFPRRSAPTGRATAGWPPSAGGAASATWAW
jgi:hypothetical protein